MTDDQTPPPGDNLDETLKRILADAPGNTLDEKLKSIWIRLPGEDTDRSAVIESSKPSYVPQDAFRAAGVAGAVQNYLLRHGELKKDSSLADDPASSQSFNALSAALKPLFARTPEMLAAYPTHDALNAAVMQVIVDHLKGLDIMLSEMQYKSLEAAVSQKMADTKDKGGDDKGERAKSPR